MPCAINSDYPDYLNSILKEIAAGNDTTLKNCACALRSPVTDEGCPVVDEDGKVGGFPFCWNLVSEGEVGYNTYYPLKMTMKQAMSLYWNSKSLDASKTTGNCKAVETVDGCRDILKGGSASAFEVVRAGKKKKEFVCFYPLWFQNQSSTSTSTGCLNDTVADITLQLIFFTTNSIGICCFFPDKGRYVKNGNEYDFYPSLYFGTLWSYGCGYGVNEEFLEHIGGAAMPYNANGTTMNIKIDGKDTQASVAYGQNMAAAGSVYIDLTITNDS